MSIDEHITAAAAFLGIEKPRVEETPWGYAVVKGNKSGEFVFGHGTMHFMLNGNLLHERVIILLQDMAEREHPEAAEEVVRNIGKVTVMYKGEGNSIRVSPNMILRSLSTNCSNVHGYTHGFFALAGEQFSVERPGMLYVAKALRPEYAQGDSFMLEPKQ